MSAAAEAWAKVDAISAELAREILKAQAAGVPDGIIVEIVDGAAVQLRNAAYRLKPGDKAFADRAETAFRAHLLKAGQDLALQLAEAPARLM